MHLTAKHRPETTIRSKNNRVPICETLRHHISGFNHPQMLDKNAENRQRKTGSKKG